MISVPIFALHLAGSVNPSLERTEAKHPGDSFVNSSSCGIQSIWDYFFFIVFHVTCPSNLQQSYSI